MKQLREKAGLRVEEVAAYIGVSHSSVRNWEKGRTIPTLGVFQMEKLLNMYRCTFNEFAEAVREAQEEAIAS